MHCTCIYMLMLIYMPYALACYLNIHTHINTPLIAHCRGQYIDYWQSLQTKYCNRNGIQPSKVGVVGTWTWFDFGSSEAKSWLCSVPIGFATTTAVGFTPPLEEGRHVKPRHLPELSFADALFLGCYGVSWGPWLRNGMPALQHGIMWYVGIGRFNLRSYKLIDGSHIRNAIGPRKYSII